MMTMTTTMMMLDMTDTCKVRYKRVRVNIVTLFEKKVLYKDFFTKIITRRSNKSNRVSAEKLRFYRDLNSDRRIQSPEC